MFESEEVERRRRWLKMKKRMLLRKRHFRLTEVDDVDFAPNRFTVLSHGLAIRALDDFDKRKKQMR